MVLTLALAGGLLFNTVQPTEVHAEETSQQMIEKKKLKLMQKLKKIRGRINKSSKRY